MDVWMISEKADLTLDCVIVRKNKWRKGNWGDKQWMDGILTCAF